MEEAGVNLERAVEIVKYGRHYARPRVKNDAEFREALLLVENHPEVWPELRWLQ